MPTPATLSISRYPVPKLEGLPEDIRARILAVQEKAGFAPNVSRTLAHRPAEFRALLTCCNECPDLRLRHQGTKEPRSVSRFALISLLSSVAANTLSPLRSTVEHAPNTFSKRRALNRPLLSRMPVPLQRGVAMSDARL